jgi:hypothetical protein
MQSVDHRAKANVLFHFRHWKHISIYSWLWPGTSPCEDNWWSRGDFPDGNTLGHGKEIHFKSLREIKDIMLISLLVNRDGDL